MLSTQLETESIAHQSVVVNGSSQLAFIEEKMVEESLAAVVARPKFVQSAVVNGTTLLSVHVTRKRTDSSIKRRRRVGRDVTSVNQWLNSKKGATI